MLFRQRTHTHNDVLAHYVTAAVRGPHCRLGGAPVEVRAPGWHAPEGRSATAQQRQRPPAGTRECARAQQERAERSQAGDWTTTQRQRRAAQQRVVDTGYMCTYDDARCTLALSIKYNYMYMYVCVIIFSIVLGYGVKKSKSLAYLANRNKCTHRILTNPANKYWNVSHFSLKSSRQS